MLRKALIAGFVLIISFTGLSSAVLLADAPPVSLQQMVDGGGTVTGDG